MSGSALPGSAHAQKNFWTRIPLSYRILGAVVLGIAVGRASQIPGTPAFVSHALENMRTLSTLVIDLLKALATPLIFFAVIDALARTFIPPRKGVKLIIISMINAVVAIAIGLGIANSFKSGEGWQGKLSTMTQEVSEATHGNVDQQLKKLQADREKAKGASLDPMKVIQGYVPKNFVDAFQSNGIITVVLIAIFAGIALRKLRNRATPETEHGVKTIEDGATALFHLFAVMLGWVVEIIPFAIFGVIAKLVSDMGFHVFDIIGRFLGIVLLGLLIHSVAYYSFILAVVARYSPVKFFIGASDAIVTSLSCGSSLATLPVTLRCLKEKLKIADSNARLAACVGTNLNHTGIILYEAATTIFIAQALGMQLTLPQQIGVALASVMAGVGIAGVPDAGLITLPLVLTAGGIPSKDIDTVLPLLLSVDWIIGRTRAAVNVISDMTVATLLERLDPDETLALDAPEATSTNGELAQAADVAK
ncbi:MAG TPA: dicarboxylate/amino acid:cation symporter [Planctomycetota bacterium]|nr:dicarboxylate/amino acid:cation symporter [Planctomycetota bacterium]